MSPTEEMYRSKSNADLKEMLEVFELATPDAKNPFKPNKDEMVKELMKFKRNQDKINGIDPEEGDEEPEDEDDDEIEEVVPKMNAKQAERQRVELARADLFRKERVIVHDTQQGQTPIPTMMVSWGNRYLGVQTDIVPLGKPWYVRRGALGNLRTAMIKEMIQDDPTKPMREEERHRYQITELDGWTDEELEQKKADQKIRNSREY